MQVELTGPQYELVTSEAKYPAFVGGFGSGKTHALMVRSLVLKARYWGLNQAYYLPTYDLVRQIAYPRFAELLAEWGIGHHLNKQDHELTLRGGGMILFRTMDRPERIVGYEVADSFVDELDTLKTDDAREVWNKIIARNRQKKPDGVPNTVAVGTTPEGFRFVYERWRKDAQEGYTLIQAPTESNAKNLPADYIDSLRRSYPANLLSAYLDGEFVNLTAGSVYSSYDRESNSTAETPRMGEPLHVGMDFNVGKMAAAVCVLRGGRPHAVDELTGLQDTPAMIAALKTRFPAHRIAVYPDASGKSRRSVDASTSDIQLLWDAGFRVVATPSNPAVKDRVLAVNQMLDKRELLVNPDTCPELVAALEQQAYDKKGEPDKSGGFDHIVDALGYYIVSQFPVRRAAMKRVKLQGL